jgi:hypothetical protein
MALDAFRAGREVAQAARVAAAALQTAPPNKEMLEAMDSIAKDFARVAFVYSAALQQASPDQAGQLCAEYATICREIAHEFTATAVRRPPLRSRCCHASQNS